jgi:hypothetical protein
LTTEEFAGHDNRGNPVQGVRFDPERPLESELAWAEANILAGYGGQAMRERKRRIEEALNLKDGMTRDPLSSGADDPRRCRQSTEPEEVPCEDRNGL